MKNLNKCMRSLSSPVGPNLLPEGLQGVQGAPPLGARRVGAPGGPPEANKVNNMIKQEYKEAQKRLSPLNGDFLDYVERNPQCFKRSAFKMMELNDKLFTLQPWPTFIDPAVREAFRESAVTLCSLVKRIPQRLFDNDPAAMADYYRLPRKVVELQLEGVNTFHIDNLLARGDFIFSDTGVKCLEFNVTPNLGGWQVPLWESLCLNTPVISRFLKEAEVEVKNENLLELYLHHIIDMMVSSRIADGGEMNAVLVVSGYDESKPASTSLYLQKMYKEILSRRDDATGSNLKGNLEVCDYNHLKVENNTIYRKNKRIHLITEMYNGMVPPDILRAFKAQNVLLLNGPIANLLSNKLNLALLSDYETSGKFTPEETQLIDRYLPWTRKIVPELADYIITNREKLVIKPSEGLGGEGISIGPKCAPQEWKAVVEQAVEGKTWLAQEMVHSAPGVYQVGEEGFELHDMVWGFFVFGSRYCGAWNRVMPRSNNKGVVNCHQGATVSVIFEV